METELEHAKKCRDEFLAVWVEFGRLLNLTKHEAFLVFASPEVANHLGRIWREYAEFQDKLANLIEALSKLAKTSMLHGCVQGLFMAGREDLVQSIPEFETIHLLDQFEELLGKFFSSEETF